MCVEKRKKKPKNKKQIYCERETRNKEFQNIIIENIRYLESLIAVGWVYEIKE